jgi:hypothetical protein
MTTVILSEIPVTKCIGGSHEITFVKIRVFENHINSYIE